jgi:hypothetical protein
MGTLGKLGLITAAGVLALLVAGAVVADPQQLFQYGFEGRDTLWVQGPNDASAREVIHRLTDIRQPDQKYEYAHGGQRSEFLYLEAQPGSFIHYTFAFGRAPVTEDLSISLWVRCNRPGVQLSCRVVLPREPNPARAGEPLTVLLPVDTYKLLNRWQPLSLRQPMKLLREQVQLLRASLKRDVITEGAFADQLVLNVYTGPGETLVWTDDLEIGPVTELKSINSPGPGGVTGRPPLNPREAEVDLRGQQLLVSGHRFFLLGIRHTGTPLKVLRDAGFNAVWLDETTPPGLVEDAVNLGFWVVPTLSPPDGLGPGDNRVPGQLTSRSREEALGTAVTRFLDTQAVLFWDLGGNLTLDQAPAVNRLARRLRDLDPLHPVAADVVDGFRSYTSGDRRLMVGTHRWPLLTSMDMLAYRDWLQARRRLVYSGTFCWTWIQTHLPDWFLALVYDRGPGGRFDEPIGPQPEQIRLLAYTAVGCGYRGLGFWSDRFLADSHTGRDRLLELALLNQEFVMLEPLLLGDTPREPEWIDTSLAEVKAAVLRSDKGVLVLPIWVGPGTQFVPPQGGAIQLKLVVPQVPNTCQAWEISPGRIRSYNCERKLGGTEVVLRDFSLTSALVFTADLGPTGLVVRFQEQQRRMRKLAAQWSHDLAEEELAKALYVQAELQKLGRGIPDGDALAAKTREWLDRCNLARRNGDYTEAYTAAQVALQAVRLLMRAHWDQAIRGVDVPVSSPYTLSYYTLPRHWQFVEEVRRLRPTENLLPDGGFETPPDKVPPNWLVEEVPTLDDVVATARRVAETPHEGGQQCLRLRVETKPGKPAPGVLERTFLAIHSPVVQVPPGTVVKISAWIRIPHNIGGSPDGALFYDSIGGEPLAVRLNVPTPHTAWKQYTLYRRVGSSGKVNVTLALTGVGTVYFDDVKIEPLAPRDDPGSSSAFRGTGVAGR